MSVGAGQWQKWLGILEFLKDTPLSPRKLAAKQVGLAKKLEFLVNLSRNFRLGILV